MGLLDDPNQLAAIVGLLQGRQPAGGLLMQYAQNIEQGKQRKSAEELRQLQMQQLQMDMAAKKQAQERDQGLRSLQGQYFQPGMPAQQQMGPTPDGSQMPMGLPTEPRNDQAGYAQAAMSKGWMTPMEAAQLHAKEQMVIPAGSTVAMRGPDGSITPKFQAPDKPPPGFYGQPGSMSVDPAWEASQIKLRQAGRPMTNINMPPLEKKEQGDKGALNVKNYGEIQDLANSARKENALLSAMERNPIETGKGAPAAATIAGWLTYAGLGGDRAKEVAANSERFQGAAMELVLQKQLAQKGPQTESDAKRLEQTVGNLGNTDAGNKAIIAFSKAANNRTIAHERFLSAYWKKNKTYEGASDAWYSGEGGKSLWEDPALAKYAGGAPKTIDFADLPRAGSGR